MKIITGFFSPYTVKKLKTSVEVSKGLTKGSVSETGFVPDCALVQEQGLTDCLVAGLLIKILPCAVRLTKLSKEETWLYTVSANWGHCSGQEDGNEHF
jgi:hypothetical protein